VFVTLLLSLTSGLLGVNKMSMQRIVLQMRSLAPATLGEFEKERTRLCPKSDFFFFAVRNWMCGVSACENKQKRVSHGETVRVGSSVICHLPENLWCGSNLRFYKSNIFWLAILHLPFWLRQTVLCQFAFPLQVECAKLHHA